MTGQATAHRVGGAGHAAEALTGDECRVLAALVRRPQGLRGVRAVAAAAGVDGDVARSALSRLAERCLVKADEQAARGPGPATRETVWVLQVGAGWFQVAGDVRAVTLPEPGPPRCADKLPARFAHLFWWGEATAIELPRDAAFVAEHLLACHDIAAWAWALAALPAPALERVADKTHTPAWTKAMIRNTLKARNGAAH